MWLDFCLVVVVWSGWGVLVGIGLDLFLEKDILVEVVF